MRLDDIGHDLRYALRMLGRTPGVTAVVVLTLALGIGANSAIFSLVDAVLLRPLPFRQPQQLVRIYSEFPTFPRGGLHRFWISGPEYLELLDTTRSWQSLNAWVVGGENLSGDSQPLRVQAAQVTGGLLRTLGVAPALGRAIAASDDQPGAPQVADISWNLWQRAYAADPAILGRQTEMDGQHCAIIGVMPRGFEFPIGETQAVELWTPLRLNPAQPGGASSHYLYLLGRLKPGVSLAAAQSEFHALEAAWGPEAHSAHRHNFSLDVHPISSYPLQTEVTGPVRPALLLLLGAVGLVLLIACVNVASLLLARAEVRQREIAIRGALGAGRGRLLRQFVTEGIVLALLGAVAGMALAEVALRLLKSSGTALGAASIPRLGEVGLDPRVLGFTLGLALLTGVGFGLAPLAHVAGQRFYLLLKATGGGTTGSRGAQRFRKALVVGEISLALVLLVGAGLLVRGFWNLQQVTLGFQPDGLTAMELAWPSATPSQQTGVLLQRLQQALARLPGGQAAALASGLPPNRPPDDNDTAIEGFVLRPGGPIQNVEYYQAVSPSYFATMQVAVLRGRLFDQRDGAAAPGVVIVNQRMAATFWPGQSPIGHRVRAYGKDWQTVVGEVADVKNKGVDQAAGTELYFPMAQAGQFGLTSTYVLTRNPHGLAPDGAAVAAVRELVRGIDPALPLAHVRAMQQELDTAEARPRLLALLLILFAAVALGLAAVGIYGVMSYTVAQRQREFGLRAALGAKPDDLLQLVLGQGLALALIGVAVGGVAALTAMRLMGSLLFGVQPSDPATFAAMAALLVLVALAACWLPARRATRIDPLMALREG